MPVGRWAGVDEAGYGPNLGPLVMSAVVAEGERPDLWVDLATTVCRAGGRCGRLWVDDSKRVYTGGVGLDRLEAATGAMLAATGVEPPSSLDELLLALGSSASASELDRWVDPLWPPRPVPRERVGVRVFDSTPADGTPRTLTPSPPGDPSKNPLDGANWRIVGVRTVALGPARFNEALTGSKAAVHASVFAELIAPLWDRAGDGVPNFVRSDKHGGRNFYADVLSQACPGATITPVVEGPALSRYVLTSPGRRVEVAFEPRADAGDGLVALASMASKAVRERWMGVFNAYWARRVPGLRPTAGYPVDARRFRDAIEPEARRLGLGPEVWWRAK